MEAEASRTNEEDSHIGDQKYCIMATFSTILDTKVGEIHETKVRYCVDYLGDVERPIVILILSALSTSAALDKADFFTPIDRSGDRIPIA